MRLEDRQEPYTGYTIQYIYGVDGIIGFHIGDIYYYYQKNLQGDVVELIRYVPSHDDKQLIATYVYDAWGNHKVLNPDGTENTDSSFIGNKNPIRYRSYYYDVETGLYYLKTRYYDPRTGRFISPDSTYYLDPSMISGMNLYAYCLNNPVMYNDESGQMPEWLGNVLLGATIIAGAALLFTAITFTGGTAGAFLIAAGKAAFTGFKIAATAGVVSGAIRTGRSLVKNISEGNNFENTMINAGKSFLTGFGDGFLNGAKYYMTTGIVSIGASKMLKLYNDGYGFISTKFMVGYINPKVFGITLFSSKIGNKFRIDLDPVYSFHYHNGKSKKQRKKHKGSWIAGIFIGVYSGFDGEIY